MRNNEFPVSFWNVTCEHHCFGRGTQNTDAVFGCSNAGVFILRANDVIGVVGFEVGSEFFVQRGKRVFITNVKGTFLGMSELKQLPECHTTQERKPKKYPFRREAQKHRCDWRN